MEGHLERALAEVFYAMAEAEQRRPILDARLGADGFQLLTYRLGVARTAIDKVLCELSGAQGGAILERSNLGAS